MSLSAPTELISWDVLFDNYLSRDVPIEQPILHDPEFRLIFDSSSRRLGVRLSVDSGGDWKWAGKLRNISVRNVVVIGREYVEVSTDSRELFRSIYALLGDVLRRVSDGERDCMRALELSLCDFEALVARSTSMSKEQALGLYGELHVLETMLIAGVADVNVWIGPKHESHDFRMENSEFEVKTTASNIREHLIHGQNQLTPTMRRELYLISIRLSSVGSGDGRSVDDLVERIRRHLTEGHGSRAIFDHLLTEARYRPGEFECAAKYVLAAPVMVLKIGTDFPSLGVVQLTEAMGREAVGRVKDLQLRINVEGLGVEFSPTRWTRG